MSTLIADTVIASGPRSEFLSEASRVLKPGGRIYINGNFSNKFFRLPDASTLQTLRLKVVVENGPLDPMFNNLVFRRTDGTEIPKQTIKTTVLEKLP